MFKTRLTNYQETLIAAGLNFGLLILFIVNLLVLVPVALNILEDSSPAKNRELIDAKTVNQAIEELNKTGL